MIDVACDCFYIPSNATFEDRLRASATYSRPESVSSMFHGRTRPKRKCTEVSSVSSLGSEEGVVCISRSTRQLERIGANFGAHEIQQIGR